MNNQKVRKPRKWELVYKVIYSEQDTEGNWYEVRCKDYDSESEAKRWMGIENDENPDLLQGEQ
jgi:hypothetical protein